MSELINNQSKERQEKLKSLIKRLHEGEDLESVRTEFEAEFKDVSTEEIAAMEGALVAEGMDVEEIRKLCDVHARMLGTKVSDIHKGGTWEDQPGHPLKVLKDENRRVEKLIEAEIVPYLSQEGNHAILMLRVGTDRLSEIKKHYARKEQLFFPYLEKKGVTAPPQVMWAVDDEIRDKLNHVSERLATPGVTVKDVKEEIEALIHQINEMIFKEDNILIPLLEDKLNLYNFIQIAEGSDEVGYFLEPPAENFTASETEEEPEKEEGEPGMVEFDAGSLLPKEINAILNTVPLDMTYVDKDGHVRYFTQGKERIFDRPKTILGRHVNMCHPPSSVHVVEKIVENFRSGRKDNEDFWINMGGKMVHIRYFAVRDKDGAFLGTLEMTQNITPIRELSGEKRLMDDDD